MPQLASAVAPTPAIDPLRERLDARLGELLPAPCDPHDRVCLAMREATLAPGKRIRPILMVLAGRELGCDAPALVDLGCAVEMVHSASLILDDMPCMDGAALRRGRPTVHRRFGEDVAVLAAVALLSQAFRVVASLPDVAPPLRNRLVASLADVVGTRGLVRGQYQDLHDGRDARGAQDISHTNELKTGVLFATALDMAGLVAGASVRARQALRRFALELGQAFQLHDDLQDRGDSTRTGKDTGRDAGKSTLLALLGPDEVRRRLRAHVAAAESQLERVYGPDCALGAYLDRLFAAA
ncbi:polyprenyl synthetase family protein [Coralloluteibacterium stylophorae]|uniref:Polyprenyl synthetase family protein n=1 Tax=Coralloluteibacterium stylophorae TaxID=1776034 RepID=A0A8J7VUD2_9GAMM|nr:polyprenyl synthetase family protein [Coralloluteibacterium stylophorae]MBS7458260.1 polyprenyl synthetase family protein [Coralloluteibacterium stylophorae]